MRQVLLALLIAIGFASAAGAQMFVVNSPDDGFLNLRAEASGKSAIILQLKHGSQVEGYRRHASGKWIEVIAPDGVFGYVSLKYLRHAPGYENVRVVISPDGELNMRSGPGTQFEVLGSLQNDEFTVTILEQKGKWARIRNYDGQTGWVYSKYLR